MGQRGRKSAGALSVVGVDGKPSQLSPPSHLGTDEARRFRELVATVDTRHFRPSDVSLLCRYVEADGMAELAAKELREHGPVVDGRPSPWITIQEKQIRALVALSMRLRLSPQSRTDSKAIGRQSPTSTNKLWDTRPWI